MQFEEGALPFRYLGVSIIRRDVCTVDCGGLIEHLQFYLGRWRTNCSRMGDTCNY